ncbi:NAD-dependent epimerase/dehydratase family protein [Leeia aquatica]|uniref:NAD-dependent epimerase/dehydratase family protein n=1 Tax=Leeia aquatica TaxID=2725557 RepID=A0A847S6Z2_9NEIS|nr:NAD-dependent epimerase/dehydratase family protein [Leeia aquatica]NLR74595.1 NAD-dependent epimerase/dehydratase family protein [Leeia aquatica]
MTVALTLPDLSGKRVLITGGLGFIGSNLAHRCLELGAQITVYDVLDPRSGGNMANMKDISHQHQIIINDVRNFEALCAAVLNQDLIFNCAAYTSHPNSMREPLIDIDVNCKGAINLLEAVRRFNPDAELVHVGTSTQIGPLRQSPIDEDHAEYPLDIYSANKTVSEKYFLIYQRAYGVRARVVRLANVYGPRSNIKSPDFGFVNYFIGLALQGRDITIFGDGSQLRNFCFVDDVAEALIMAAMDERSLGEALFAVGDQHHSVAEVSEAICAQIGGQVRYVPWPADRKAIEIGDAVISNDKARRLLGWQPGTSLAEGLQQTRHYFEPQLAVYLR